MKEIIHKEPFPHLIVEDFYDEEELELIWEELNYYTKPGKLLDAKDYGGIRDRTNAKALQLDGVYQNYNITNGPNYRNISNILTVNRKLFTSGVLETYSTIHDCCSLATEVFSDATKIRYYHDGEFYKPHVDKQMTTLAFAYFYKEPKLFSGGELYFPKYDYEISCLNNSFIIFPGWVKHGVKKVKISNSDYYKGFGRYAVTQFLVSTPWREDINTMSVKNIHSD